MRWALILFLFSCGSALFAQTAADTAWLPEYRLMRPETFKEHGATVLAAGWKNYGFIWNDQQKKLLSWKTSHPSLKAFSVFGYKPVDANIICGDKGLIISAEFSLWNDGDGLPMDYDAFKNFATEVAKKVSEVTGVKMQQVKPSPRAQTIYDFDCTDRYWRLVCGFRDDRRKQPQFLKLLIRAKGADEKTRANAKDNYKRMNELLTNLKTTDTMAIVQNVPMVDQGEKGYCVAASFARLLQYYGRDADQHEVAQSAGTSASGGTSLKQFDEAIDKLKLRYNLTADNRVFEFNYGAFRKLCGEYNKEAKKMKADELPAGTEQTYSMKAFNPSLLRSVYATRANIKKFKRAVKSNIDKGIPLLWTVELGIFPEDGQSTPQDGGHHMRLIIGYEFSEKEDLKTDKLIFSDSWGRGHEAKTMRLDDAMCITRKIILVRPRGR